MTTVPPPLNPANTGARQSSLREANMGAVTRTVLASAEPLSRAAVAAATGMTRATVSRLVDELIAGGVLTELSHTAPTGRGRPAIPVCAARGFAAVGLQVNSSTLAGRIVALSGEVLAERIEYGDFRSSEPAEVLALLANISGELVASVDGDTRLVGAGLALPGIVSTETGMLLTAPNLGWSDVDPRRWMPADTRSGLALTIGNEADYAARATTLILPSRPGPLRDFFYLSGETGIGGASVRGGEVMTGKHGWAGEIGHVSVDPNGPKCRCGSTGCLELYAGRYALLDAANLPSTTTTAEFTVAVQQGHAASTAATERAATALGIALAGAINILDIPTIVLGGHLGDLAQFLIPPLHIHLERRVLSSRWAVPSIEKGSGDRALGATGAAYYELAALTHNPARWVGNAAS